MCIAFIICVILSINCFNVVLSSPPEPCRMPFRWQDCGKPPEPVMYYWKSGSRCEVGFWRGCLPNLNMFKDEYECVQTCIFGARVRDHDYHSFNEIELSDESHSEEEPVTSAAEDYESMETPHSREEGPTKAAESSEEKSAEEEKDKGGETEADGGGGGGDDDGTTEAAATHAAVVVDDEGDATEAESL